MTKEPKATDIDGMSIAASGERLVGTEPGAKINIIDVGHSHEKLAEQLGGTLIRIQSDRIVMNDPLENVARAICEACGENPIHSGDAQGNEFRWQDYLPIASAAVHAMNKSQWRSLDESMPDPADYARVLIYTEGDDFNGEQVFDIKTDELYPQYPEGEDERSEECRLATHWMPHPSR